MPRIFDNIEQNLLPALIESFRLSHRADFCVGYFNLRGWRLLDDQLDAWQGEDERCRVLIGMQSLPHEQLREARSLLDAPHEIDNQTAVRLRRKVAEELRAHIAHQVLR